MNYKKCKFEFGIKGISRGATKIFMVGIESMIYYRFRSYKFIKDGYIWDDIHQKGDNILGHPKNNKFRIFIISRNIRSVNLRDLVNINHTFGPTIVKDL